MGLLDDATNLLDAATGAGSVSTAAGTAEFHLKEMLSRPEAGETGFVGTSYDGQDDNPNPLDAGITTEFIHFGNVHPDTGKKFPHALFDNINERTAPPEGHAIMFRDALEREAITLFGFVSSTRVILKEATESRGALEDVANMASNLLGGGNSASKPDPTQLDTFLSDIESEMQTINKPAILYPEIHAAGKKLHEIRADYITFCKSLNDFYIAPPQGNPLDAAAGALANVPGVGNIMATVQRFAFKMQDLYLAAYLQLRLNHEKSVETGAHALTIEAIKKDYNSFTYTYPVWFKQPDTQKTKKPDEKDNLLKPVTDKINEAKNAVGEQVDKFYDFMGMNGEPETTPGTASLKAIFGAMKGPTETLPNSVPSAPACLIGGMDAAMKDIRGIPEFVKKVMTRVNDANLGLLEEIYARLMANGAAETILPEHLVRAGRRHLSKKIVAIMGDLAGGLLPGGGNFSMGVPGGKTLDAQQFIAKIIEDKLIHYVDPIIEYAIGDLAGQMEASRVKAAENGAQTMEVLFGRLPWLTALMFKNTFFPVWNLVVEKVFETVSPQIAKVVATVNGVFETAKNAVDKANDYKNRADALSDQMKQGVNFSNADQLDNKLTDESEQSKQRRAQREAEQAEKDRLAAFYNPNDKDEKFPLVARVAEGKGEEVTEDVPSVPTVEEGAAAPSEQTPAEQTPGGVPTGGLPAAAML